MAVEAILSSRNRANHLVTHQIPDASKHRQVELLLQERTYYEMFGTHQSAVVAMESGKRAIGKKIGGNI